ncbi:hypothetical protein CEXT_281661 [Caerostris extrusa]|uniref:Uncharacterized protein n=1 Tax=Caerostris extrusa TaxID=172846 RepID=A0AAV4XPU6_CAEEX|nr:hypothetical protein CEXT_281661 [Caerostris extrusa]
MQVGLALFLSLMVPYFLSSTGRSLSERVSHVLQTNPSYLRFNGQYDSTEKVEVGGEKKRRSMWRSFIELTKNVLTFLY